jgi:hypothetical protein
MYVTVVGVFHSAKLAEEARRALVAVGVLERRIVVDLNQDGRCIVGVQAESSFERERIRDLLQRNGASCTEQRPA